MKKGVYGLFKLLNISYKLFYEENKSYKLYSYSNDDF